MHFRILKIVPLLIIFGVSNCTTNSNPEINCIANYIENNSVTNEINKFKGLEGIEIWRGWENLTSHLVDGNERNNMERCGLDKFFKRNNTNVEEIKGQMLMVYAVHEFWKEGKVDTDKINDEIENYLGKW